VRRIDDAAPGIETGLVSEAAFFHRQHVAGCFPSHAFSKPRIRTTERIVFAGRFSRPLQALVSRDARFFYRVGPSYGEFIKDNVTAGTGSSVPQSASPTIEGVSFDR